MRWIHPIPDVRAWVRWRERILIAEEDAAIRAARDTAPTPELRELVERVIEERERNHYISGAWRDAGKRV